MRSKIAGYNHRRFVLPVVHHRIVDVQKPPLLLPACSAVASLEGTLPRRELGSPDARDTAPINQP
jgi:hypothetical protein